MKWIFNEVGVLKLLMAFQGILHWSIDKNISNPRLELMTYLFSIFFLCESENSPDTHHYWDKTLDDETVSKAVRVDLGLLGRHGCRVVGVASVDRDRNNRCHRCKKLMQIRKFSSVFSGLRNCFNSFHFIDWRGCTLNPFPSIALVIPQEDCRSFLREVPGQCNTIAVALMPSIGVL